MATVVEDLVVRLGFQTPGADKAVNAVQGVQRALSGIASKVQNTGGRISQFFSGVAGAFKQGFNEEMARQAKDTADGVKDVGEQAKKAKDPIQMLTKAYKALLGLGAVVWFRNQGHELMDLGSVLSNTASELHTTATNVQELGYAGKSVDLEIGDLTAALRVLTRQTSAAREGSKSAADIFSDLGLAAKDVAAVPVDEQLNLVADALLKVEDPTKRAALQMQLFGRSGGKLAALLEQGSEGINQLKQDFRDLGGGLSQGAIDALGDSEQALKKLDVAVLSFKSNLVLLLGPAITRIIDGVRNTVSWLVKADKQMHLLQAGGIAAVLFGLLKLIRIFREITVSGAIANLVALGPWLALGAAIVAVAIILQDLYSGFTGGRSAILEWMAAWGGLEPVSYTLRTIKDYISGISEGLDEISGKGVLKALGEAFGTKNEKEARRSSQRDRQARIKELLDQADRLPAGDPERSALIAESGRLVEDMKIAQFGIDAPRAARGLNGARDFGFDTSHLSPDIIAEANGGGVSVEAPITVNVTKSNASAEDIAKATKAAADESIGKAARKVAAAAGKR